MDDSIATTLRAELAALAKANGLKTFGQYLTWVKGRKESQRKFAAVARDVFKVTAAKKSFFTEGGKRGHFIEFKPKEEFLQFLADNKLTTIKKYHDYRELHPEVKDLYPYTPENYYSSIDD